MSPANHRNRPNRPPPPAPSVLRRVPWITDDECNRSVFVDGHNSLPARFKKNKPERRNGDKRRSRSLDTGIAPSKKLRKGLNNNIDRNAVKSLQEEYRRSGKNFGRYRAQSTPAREGRTERQRIPPVEKRIKFARLNCSDCIKCLKYATISYALVLGIVGLFLISLGVWLLLGLKHVTIRIPVFGDVMEFLAYVLMGFGTSLVLMSILGGVGAKQENQCMLTAFSVLLATTLFMELGCGTWVYKLFGDLQGAVAGGGLTSVSLTTIGLFLSTSMCCYVRKGRPRHIASVV